MWGWICSGGRCVASGIPLRGRLSDPTLLADKVRCGLTAVAHHLRAETLGAFAGVVARKVALRLAAAGTLRDLGGLKGLGARLGGLGGLLGVGRLGHWVLVLMLEVE